MTPQPGGSLLASKTATSVCRSCGMEQPLEAFSRDRTKASGRSSICLACDRERAKRYYESNRERCIERTGRNKMARRRCSPPSVRSCRSCGAPAVSRRHWYCASCAVEARARRSRGGLGSRPRGKTSERGYGTRHQKLRKAWEVRVATGLVVCPRCGETIDPGAAWDLGHDDHDRSRYTGPEHASCNRRAAAVIGNRRRAPIATTSRSW